jgi:hypothetical protein
MSQSSLSRAYFAAKRAKATEKALAGRYAVYFLKKDGTRRAVPSFTSDDPTKAVVRADDLQKLNPTYRVVCVDTKE